MIQPERIRALNCRATQKGQFVLYWMQASQRAEYNHALEYAIQQANEQRLPVVVFFVLTDRFPEANLRHYAFMIEGLQDVEARLKKREIPFLPLRGSPEKEALKMSRQASVMVTDRGYLRVQKEWRQYVAENAPCLMIQVETDIIVPVEVTAVKEEYAAATLRPKIKEHFQRYLTPLTETPLEKRVRNLDPRGLDIHQPQKILSSLAVDRSVQPVKALQGGTSRAKRLLDVFITRKLKNYAELRDDASLDYSSHMSPYLHFGQISPLYIALKIQKAGKIPHVAKEAYLEELIVRRELSMNFVHYNPSYDTYESIPDWAKATLNSHRRDKREYLYSPEALEGARTHDPYWNAAQKEMVLTGKMHNYMRMYWGKKIIEWTSSPEEAFRIALYLNNKYELDGRDPNGFTGVAWCFGKHDRPWPERRIFGKVRYMNDAGLRRKFEIDDYVQKVRSLKE